MLPIAILLACHRGDTDDTSAVTPPGCGEPLPSVPSWESTEHTYATGLAWGDVNGDGEADLVVASGNDMRQGPVSVHFGRADRLPNEAPDQSIGLAYHGQVALGDLDGDGLDEVVVARFLGADRFDSPGGIDVYAGTPSGLAGPVWSTEGLYTFGVALGDADGDGDLDLAAAVGEPYQHAPMAQAVWHNDAGDFGLAPAWTSADLAHALDVAWVDVDDDGDLDLAEARSGSAHAVYLNDGGLGERPGWFAGGDGFDGIAVDFGDRDGDGLPELLFTDNTYTGGAGKVRLYGGSDGALVWEAGDGEPWSAASLIDVDGDDILDVAAGEWFGGVTVWHGRTDGVDAAPAWRSDGQVVVEAMAWRDIDGSDVVEGRLSGVGLIAVPRGAVVIEAPAGSAIGDGYVSGEGAMTVRIATSPSLDLAVATWDPEIGSQIHARCR